MIVTIIMIMIVIIMSDYMISVISARTIPPWGQILNDDMQYLDYKPFKGIVCFFLIPF